MVHKRLSIEQTTQSTFFAIILKNFFAEWKLAQRNDCMLDEELLLTSLEYNMLLERTVEAFSKIRSSSIAEKLEVLVFLIVAE